MCDTNYYKSCNDWTNLLCYDLPPPNLLIGQLQSTYSLFSPLASVNQEYPEEYPNSWLKNRFLTTGFTAFNCQINLPDIIFCPLLNQ